MCILKISFSLHAQFSGQFFPQMEREIQFWGKQTVSWGKTLLGVFVELPASFHREV